MIFRYPILHSCAYGFSGFSGTVSRRRTNSVLAWQPLYPLEPYLNLGRRPRTPGYRRRLASWQPGKWDSETKSR
jgi:hypothetical protein